MKPVEGIAIKSLLVAVNAKYIHTNLAVRSIAAYSHSAFGKPLGYAEFTINQRSADVLRALYQSGADCFLFSCYIWNIEFIGQLVPDLSRLLPQCRIVLGGPEAGWQAEHLLQTYSGVQAILLGEGEHSACLLLHALEHGDELGHCPGIAFRQNGRFTRTGALAPLDLAELPFAYRDLDKLTDRIPYYESMRGCPFSCSYCLSLLDKGVRFRPLDMVFQDLQIFLDAGVRQVKFVDRTFNCSRGRALQIWKFLQQRDNGITNFHFEMAGDLLDSESIAFLATARPGLFQFEIGVQSTHAPTLAAIHRSCDFGQLAEHVRALQSPRNIHLHLDLIAGLPNEDFASFSRSFDEVYALAPQQLQLGFLKLLGGSQLRNEAAEHGIVFRLAAPYEVLYTRWLTYDELCVLHGVESMVDSFYNSGRFRHLLEYLLPFFPSPFAFYRLLWTFYEQRQQGAPLSKIDYYNLLGEFMQLRGIPITQRAKWLCRYDLMLHEKPRKIPTWADTDLYAQNRAWLAPARRLVGADAHIEVFPFCPPGGPDGECVVVFHYRQRDITGRARAQVWEKEAFLHTHAEIG